MNPPSGSRSPIGAWERRLFAPVDITFLVWFRVLFGLMLLIEVYLFFHWNMIERYFVAPPVHFKFYGFGWVEPLSATGMNVLFLLMGVFAFGVTIGIQARWAVGLFGLAFTYVFLLEKARYMNHFYLMILLCGLLSVMPCGGALSLDGLLHPEKRRNTVPAWMLRILQFQFGVVYFFAGIAKLHPDWLSGRVMGVMLHDRIGEVPALDEWIQSQPVILATSYGALLFDLLAAPLLLWRKTRLIMLAVAACFHSANAVLFTIDVFPWLMLGGTILLFFPDRLPKSRKFSGAVASSEAAGSGRRRSTLAVLVSYAALQIIIPLRHFAYPGDAAWTYEGQNFAWRMLMLTKVGLPPKFPLSYTFKGERYNGALQAPQDIEIWRTHWQWRMMLLDPDLILQFVHLQAENLRRQGAEDVDIRAIVRVSMNGRYPQLLIDPEANLAAMPRSLMPKSWIQTFDRNAEADQ